jgi:hypothetical protein
MQDHHAQPSTPAGFDETSSATIVDVSARPAKYLYASGNSSTLYDWSFKLTRRIHNLYSFGQIIDMPVFFGVDRTIFFFFYMPILPNTSSSPW